MSILDRDHSWGRVLLAGLALHLMTVMACGAPPATAETLAQRRKEIASRSEAERQELVRKYDQYQRLSVDERQKLEDIHKTTESDPELKTVMQNYCNWLRDLDVTQREELRHAQTPEQKRNLVVRFHAIQLKRKEEVWRENNSLPPEKQRPFSKLLTSDELKTVMTALEVAAVEDGILDQKTQAALAKIWGTPHYKLLMRAIGDYRHQADGQPREFEVPQSAKKAFEEILFRVEGRQDLRTRWRSNASPNELRTMFFYLLYRSTEDEARREFRGPDADKLKELLFSALPADKQAQFSLLPREKQDPFLWQMHLNEIMRAFKKAGDLPMLNGDGNQPGRPGGDHNRQFRNNEGNRALRSPLDRSSDQSPPVRRPQP